MKAKETDEQISKIINLLEVGSLFGYEAERSIKSICNEYAKERCREQRRICSDNAGMEKYTDLSGTIYIKDNVLNAPEPEMP